MRITYDSEVDALYIRFIETTVTTDKYRARLARKGKLDQKADEVLAELRRIREDIAASDYQN